MQSLPEPRAIEHRISSHHCAIQWTHCEGYLIKLIPVLALTVGFGLYRLTFSIDLTRQCLYDFGHEFLYPLNRFMYHDKISIVTLVGQELMDASIVAIMVYWMLKIKNMQFPMASCIFYAMRTLSLRIFILPFPTDMAWKKPPFPSFMVPYDRTRDFYFSGHTGIAILILLQARRLGLPLWCKVYCYFQLFWLIVMLVASRTHYSIDIVGGVFFGLLAMDLSKAIIEEADWAWSVPYLLGEKLKNKCCKRPEVQYEPLSDELK